MKTPPLFSRRLLCLFLPWLMVASLVAKPPASPNRKPTPEPSSTVAPTPTPPDPGAVDAWLVRGHPLTLPLAQIVLVTTGSTVLPADPANPLDASVIAKLGTVMDRVLPGMNKPESPAHVVSRADEVVAFFEDAIRAFAATTPGLTCPEPTANPAAVRAAGSFPGVRVVADGKSYYLGVTLYPTGGRDAAVRALRFNPGESTPYLTESGACLLVAIESNGKTGKEIAFLNWELIDLAKVPFRFVTTFEASQGDTHPTGAVLTDGRKGRD